MIELMAEQKINALPLFEAAETHQIARSCCRGLAPGRVLADRAENPAAAVITLQRFGIAFAAGDARHAAVLLEALRGFHPWYEVNEPPEDWQPALAAWSRESHATVRYAFEPAMNAFDREALAKLAVPADGYRLVPYDAQLLRTAAQSAWSEDQMGTFMSPESFVSDGMGFAMLEGDRLVSGCTSFCRHPDGFEIQVDTHPEYRGKGFATTVSAAFILRCLELGQKPYWDAANIRSMRLAQRLGFVFRSGYVAWLLISPSTTPQDVAEKAVGV